MDNNWYVAGADEAAARVIAKEVGLSLLTSRILCARGQDTPAKVRDFLSMNYLCRYDPFLLADMDKAVERINRAIDKKERVCIYGDYDVDGVTSTTILYKYLTKKGVPCSYFIPGRLEDGYGLNKRVIAGFEGKTDLIVTVDTGITAVEEAEYARSLGIDMVVTDHHSCRETLPDACAVVDPHRADCRYPFKQLAGVGVVYKLLSALDGGEEGILNRFGDIIAIGTIADVMPIVDENRYITACGIELLQNTSNLGLKALIELSGLSGKYGEKKRISSTSVGFTIAPRINAAGRIRNAGIAVELLLAESVDKAYSLAEKLCEINKERQATELDIYGQAIEQLERGGKRDFYVLSSDSWHQGVIGVVASRITERYARPSILLSFDGEVGKGSGRSIKGFSILDALAACSDLLTGYGGHELAAGLTVERSKLGEFTERINAYAAERISESGEELPVFADAEVGGADISIPQAKEIARLEPFGLQNPVPLLLMRGAQITEVQPLSGGKHIRLRLREGGRSISAVYFGQKYSDFKFNPSDLCDFLFTLEASEFHGLCEAKMFVKKVRPHGRQ